MKAPQSLLVTLAFLIAAFAGCSGEDEVLKAAFVATAADGAKSQFKFDASSSTGKGLKFAWDFGDRSEPGTGETTTHTYEYVNGEYDVTLTVTDATGAKKTITVPVATGSGTNTAPLLYLSADKRRVLADEEVFFDASMSVDSDGDPLFFEWDFNSQLDDQALNSLENLGNQQYGRYPDGKSPPSGASGGDGASGGESDGGSSEGRTPSGHDWQHEVEKARQRLLKEMGIEELHGGAEGAAEPRNADFDGTVDDTSPVQFYKFPSAAVYYVHVRVEDIKGDGQEGFIKISVDTTVPPASNSTTLEHELEPAATVNLGPANAPGVSPTANWKMQYDFPGESILNLSYTVTPEGGDKLVAVYLCGTQALCKDSAIAKLDAGASGRSLNWTIGPGAGLPYPYYIYIDNQGQSVVEVSAVVATNFDLNPWAKDEAGFGGAHH